MAFKYKLTYDDFKNIYTKDPSGFQKKKSAADKEQGLEATDYYSLTSNAYKNYSGKASGLTIEDYDSFLKQYEKETKATQQAAQSQAISSSNAQAQQQAQSAAQEQAAKDKSSMDAELAKLQQQLVATQTAPQAAGTPTPTPIEQVAQQYQQQISSYQEQLANTQTTLFSQLATQQAEQQKKAADMFGGYQQYTEQLKGEWQQGLKQTQDLIGGLQTSYQNQLTGLQGVFQQSLEESRAARETETQERTRIQGLLEQQAAAAVESKNSQQRFQQSAELIAAKKQQDLTRSFNRASSQATFGVLSNQRRRGGASQTIFSDSGTTSQNPYGYSNIFFS